MSRKPTKAQATQLAALILGETRKVEARSEAFVVEGTLSAKERRLEQLRIAAQFNSLALAMYDDKGGPSA